MLTLIKMNRRTTVINALKKLGEASPSQIWKALKESDPTITIQDVSFELYHGSRDPQNQVYEKIGRGRYRLLK